MSKTKIRHMYRVSWDAKGAAFVEDIRVLSGPDEDGRYKVRARYGPYLIHQDWVRDSADEAIEHEEQREVARHKKKMDELAALRTKRMEGR